MAINKGIIKKYTQALFKVAVKENDINQISDCLHNIRSILKSVPELNQLLITRRVKVQDKINMLKNILGDNIGALLGWLAANYLDKLGVKMGWYDPHIK